MHRLSLALVALCLIAPPAHSDTPLDLSRLVKNGSIRVERSDGSPLLRYRDDTPLVPASVLKVATAFCAMEQLGTDYRFETLFFTDESGTLFIRGAGDPSLVSETLESIALELAAKVRRIEHIVIDTSFFADDLQIDGSERSLNPYDAKNAAFVGNFSSAMVTHSKAGAILSAEPQTPLTPIARQAGLKLRRGTTDRVNLSTDWRVGARYGGELLGAFLKKHGTLGAMEVSLGPIPPSAKLVVRHQSPATLRDITKGMLEHSTNFTANQLFLLIGAKVHGAPATVSKGQQAMRQCLETRIGWRDFHIEEGSGLSRRNRVTSLQMTELLRNFERYRFLLPERDGFLAKTGSLRGVNSLAGYFNLGSDFGQARFCILINSDVPHMYKFQVASTIREYLRRHQSE